MAIDFSQLPPPTSDFPAKKKQTNQASSQNEAPKNLTHKTKEIRFRKRDRQIVLQNENGPCPLIAICNVLLLRNEMNLYPDRFQVPQERLLSLVADVLFDNDDDEYTENQQQRIADAINLLPRLADGINVNIRFRRIDDFESTPELAIFDLLSIPLYHGWIVDPQDFETANAIGCKSYNDLMTGLVTLETQTKTRAFADSTPTYAEHSQLGRGDIEEERVLLRALRLSEREKLGIDARRDSSSGGDSVSGYSDVYLMSESDSLVDSMDAGSPFTSTPGSANTCQKSKCNDQVSSKESGDETVCVLGNKFDVAEETHSSTPGALASEQLSSTELGDETASDVESNIKMVDVHVILEKTNLESTKNDSSSEIQFKSEAVNFVNPDLTGISQDDDNVALYEAEKSVTVGSPVYKGQSPLGQSSSEGKDTNGVTPREGEVIKNFLNNNASQLTFPGLFFLEQGLEEGELCVFFRNNHFHTMLKYGNELYNLVTDQGYLNERDLVWEKLNEVNGDSVFVDGDFKVFKCESGNWDQQNALSSTADYIYSINSASKEGMEVDPDLKMAMELQEQELAEDIGFEVSMKKQSHVFFFFSTRSESSPTMVQRWHMYNHECKFSSLPCKG
ncbi:BnaA01g12730D [Brassica napus]|uniref:BnaA01g12730D protein n=1 Tax=Brassica napus TaxID=3708 RepID=A0A078HUA1_BRANA|nr:BnaA01g12730D [Brassica napus]